MSGSHDRIAATSEVPAGGAGHDLATALAAVAAAAAKGPSALAGLVKALQPSRQEKTLRDSRTLTTS
jgi:hypothetical protein